MGIVELDFYQTIIKRLFGHDKLRAITRRDSTATYS